MNSKGINRHINKLYYNKKKRLKIFSLQTAISVNSFVFVMITVLLKNSIIKEKDEYPIISAFHLILSPVSVTHKHSIKTYKFFKRQHCKDNRNILLRFLRPHSCFQLFVKKIQFFQTVTLLISNFKTERTIYQKLRNRYSFSILIELENLLLP